MSRRPSRSPSSAAPACTSSPTLDDVRHPRWRHASTANPRARCASAASAGSAWPSSRATAKAIRCRRTGSTTAPTCCALKDIGAQRVLAINTVGGITDALRAARARLPDQMIDYTWGRITHACATSPAPRCCTSTSASRTRPALRAAVLDAAAAPPASRWWMAAATAPPRGRAWKPRAEIARMRRDGCDLVGMTGMPEAGAGARTGPGLRLPGPGRELGRRLRRRRRDHPRGSPGQRRGGHRAPAGIVDRPLGVIVKPLSLVHTRAAHATVQAGPWHSVQFSTRGRT